jgi:hypothetical protein
LFDSTGTDSLSTSRCADERRRRDDTERSTSSGLSSPTLSDERRRRPLGLSGGESLRKADAAEAANARLCSGVPDGGGCRTALGVVGVASDGIGDTVTAAAAGVFDDEAAANGSSSSSSTVATGIEEETDTIRGIPLAALRMKVLGEAGDVAVAVGCGDLGDTGDRG